MKTENKNRRSARIPAKHNIMLMVEGAEGQSLAKEVVTTVRISRHGAQLLGRNPLRENSTGKVAHLSTCRQAPFRIAWQAPSTEKPGFHEIGIEFEDLSDFWGGTFPGSDPAQPAMANPSINSQLASAEPLAAAASRLSSSDILQQLRTIPASKEGREITDAIWCGLIEQLEERRVISRNELISSLRKVGLQL
jgi:hypothetical protein